MKPLQVSGNCKTSQVWTCRYKTFEVLQAPLAQPVRLLAEVCLPFGGSWFA